MPKSHAKYFAFTSVICSKKLYDITIDARKPDARNPDLSEIQTNGITYFRQ